MAASPHTPATSSTTAPARARHCVLLVSNDHDVAGIWAFALHQKGLQVTLTSSASAAWAAWSRSPCSMVVIDVCGPDLDGLELTRRLKAEATNPILLLTPKHDEAHILDAYRAGVDECIVKPISPSLFLAKIQAWLRRAGTVPAQTLDDLRRGTLHLDASLQEVRDGEGPPVRLTNLEFRVLYLLMSHEGQTLAADTIVERVWGLSGEGDASLLKNVIYRLRRKIEPDPNQPRYLKTVGRRGYVLSTG